MHTTTPHRVAVLRRALAPLLLATGLVVVPTLPAAADDAAGVPDVPRNDTPFITGGEVHDSVLVGDTVFVGGDFTGVRQSNGDTEVVPQDHLVAYDVNSGQLVASFDPQVNGAVYEIEASEDGQHLFIGGEFTTVDGHFSERVAKITLAGSVVTAFDSDVDARVDGLAVGNGRVYVGGDFLNVGTTPRSGLAALDATTGAVDPTFDLPISEPIGRNGVQTVRALDITPDHATLLSVHNAGQVDGLDRAGVALIDLTGPTAEVSPWHTQLYRDNYHRCAGGDLQLRDGALSPDGSYLVTVGRGNDRPPVCDTAIRLDLAIDADGENDPVWISRHHDSIYSVTVSPDAVFIGGHFRSVEEPGHGDPEPWVPGDPDKIYDCAWKCAYERLAPEVGNRNQLAALRTDDGKAWAWNPGTDAFQAVFSLTWTERGLLLGQDRTLVAGYNVGNHAFFDVDDIVLPDAAAPTVTTVTPAAQAVFASGSLTVDGTAGDDVRVDEVRLAVKDRATGAWFDPTSATFGPYTNFRAVLDPPRGATSVNWSLDLDLPDGSYLLVATARDQASGASTPSYTQFSVTSGPIDVDAPVVTMATPGAGDQVAAGTVSLVGTASDDVAVDEVVLAVRRTGDGTWYDVATQSFAAGYRNWTADLSDAGATDTGWSHDVVVGDGDFSVTVLARDAVGRTSPNLYRSFSTTSGPIDRDAPVVVVDTPAAGVVLPAGPSTLGGTATDDVSVGTVRLALKNTADATWYDVATDTFVVGYRNWDATLAAPGSAATSWTSPVTLGDGRYSLTVKAVDGANRDSANVYRTFTVASGAVDQHPPTATVSEPQGGGTVGDGTVVLQGTASDDVRVAEVRLALKNTSDNTWYDEATESFLPGYRQFGAGVGPGDVAVDWFAFVTLPPGDHTLTTFAVDAAGRRSSSVYTSFTVGSGVEDVDPPTVAMSSPAPGATVPKGVTVLAGSASDDLAVDEVRVAVKHKASGDWYDHATGSFRPGWRSFAADLSDPGSDLSDWSADVDLPATGAYTVTVFARDGGANRSDDLYRTLHAQ